MSVQTLVNKNNAYLKGIIVSPFVFAFSVLDKMYYRGYIEIQGISGIRDRLPIVTEEKKLNPDIQEGSTVKVNGNVRTRNYEKKGRKKVDVYVYAYDIKHNSKKGKYANEITLDGYVCKEPIVRYSPTGKKLLLMVLANNRENGTVNYIPCVCFSQNIERASHLKVGDLIQLQGRFQSRTYQKKNVQKTTYEVAMSNFQKI